ncbi:MAG: hypothetical protein M1830_002241 [Pleopsidium flavum]|nr:MAG: hypothetical protein M1830_002241 [Pleopsidium flavum]
MLDMRGGVMVWEYTWSPANSNGLSFQVAYTMFAHKYHVNQGIVQLQITPSSDCNVTMANVVDGTSAVRTDFIGSGMDGQAIYSAVKPNGINSVAAYIYAAMEGSAGVDASTLKMVSKAPYLGTNDSSIAQIVNASLKAGQTTTVTKYVGGASSDGFEDPQGAARNACMSAMKAGYDQSLLLHAAEWAIVFPEDSVDDYTYPGNGSLPADPNIIEAAIVAVANPYYLLQNTISADALHAVAGAPIDANSISVGGLGSDSYAGLIFWDAEIWMQPGLVAAFPDAAKQIANYRVVRYRQALANAQTGFTSSKNQTGRFSNDSAVFSWTSGRYGNCTGTGPCFDYEYHINGDIAQEFANYWIVTGDTQFFQNSLFPVYDSIATFYSEVLEKNGSYWVLTNMTDPDEYANNVDNGGYTMPLIADTLMNANMFREMFGMSPNATWTDQATNIYISRDSGAGIIDEYTGMNGSIAVKQADVVLNTFPLAFMQNYTAQDSLRDLDYYAGKQSLNGPGMTYAIFSIVAEEVSPSGCASFTYQLYSEQPYARAPWFQFSEQLTDDFVANGGTHPAYPFLTGHGGANQVTLFGYLGFRLIPDSFLHLDPSIPPQIANLRYRTFYWQGWPISARSNQTHTTVTRLGTPYTGANRTFADTPIPVIIANNNNQTYQLKPNGTLTFSNRQTGLIKTVPGNIAQCLPVTSPDEYLPGQFPLSAVDGAASTKWQPAHSNISQSITVALSTIEQVGNFYFDWAQNPPVNFTVQFHNSSTIDANAVAATRITNVQISIPYNVTEVNIITPYMANTTNVTLNPPVYSGNYATLTIEGNQGNPVNNGSGASVAEWAIVAASGQQMGMKLKPRSSSVDLGRYNAYAAGRPG